MTLSVAKVQLTCCILVAVVLLCVILVWSRRTRLNPLPAVTLRHPESWDFLEEEKDTLDCDDFFLPTSLSKGNRSNLLIEDKYTIIMPAFRRSDILGTVLGSYCNITEVDKIILVWNNVHDEPPFQIGNDLNCGREVLVLRQKSNVITNRFRPTSHVHTEGEGVCV